MDSEQLQKKLNELQEKNDAELFKGKGRAELTKRSKNEDLIISSINLVEYYNTYIVPLAAIFKPMASKAGICPFHNDTDPSFHANQSRGFYHCFGCGFGGNIIKVYRQIQQNYFKRTITKAQAIQELGVLYGITLHPEEESDDKKDKFALAKAILTDHNFTKEYTGDVTLAQYVTNNNKVLHSGLSFEQIMNQLGELDLVLTAYLEVD